jgi:hypothetical protein
MPMWFDLIVETCAIGVCFPYSSALTQILLAPLSLQLLFYGCSYFLVVIREGLRDISRFVSFLL